MDVQWYPGHMTKAKRAMQEDIKLVDLVIELIDARLPLSSRNPDIDSLAGNKSRIVLLNKADLADDRTSKAWVSYFEEKGILAELLDSRGGKTVRKIQPLIDKACAEKKARDLKRGIKNRPVRAMICGIPNVGKSTFINSFAGKSAAKTGNKPGVTKGKQWIRLNKDVELLDTPGILWPKFEDQNVGIRLALIGSIRDEILRADELSAWLINYLRVNYPGMLNNRYGIDELSTPEDLTSIGDDGSVREILASIAVARNAIAKGGEPDYDRACMMILDDLRSGRLGKISLENPPSAS